MGEGLQGAVRAARRTRLTEREGAVLKALASAEDGLTGPELHDVARKFGCRHGMYEWGSPLLRALADMGYALKLPRKRRAAWVWMITEDGRSAASATA